jgi:OFA family oxalate/formate antiporter-like MFS transporter
MLAGKIADATGSYALAYSVASGLLLFAVFLAMVSYINISVNIPERELKIKLGKSKTGKPVAAKIED